MWNSLLNMRIRLAMVREGGFFGDRKKEKKILELQLF